MWLLLAILIETFELPDRKSIETQIRELSILFRILRDCSRIH